MKDHKHLPTRKAKGKPVRRCEQPGCGWMGRDYARHVVDDHGGRLPLVYDPEPFDEFTGPMGPERRADA